MGLPDALGDLRFRACVRAAVGIGSRGVHNLPLIVRTLVALLRAQGTSPAIVPAMGSDGGATAPARLQCSRGWARRCSALRRRAPCRALGAGGMKHATCPSRPARIES